MAYDPQIGEQRWFALSALIGLAIVAWAPLADPPWWKVGATLALLALALRALGKPGAGAVIAVLAAPIALASTLGLFWQLGLPLALGVLALARWWQRDLPGDHLRAGRVPKWGTLVCAAVTPIGLVGWVLVARPEVTDITSAIPAAPVWALVLGAIAFALVNAYLEERIWRGVFQTQLAALFSAPLAIALQAASFGLAHAHGFPRGGIGILLAGSWGAMLGVVRARAGGLLAPVAAHVVADATIAAIVLLWLDR